MDYLNAAIQKLKPNSEYVYSGDDYSSINWHVLEGDAPTKKEIDDVIKVIKANEAKTVETKANAKTALLERLGLTEDEAKLLLS